MEFVDIKGFEGKYFVSREGYVKAITRSGTRILKTGDNGNGYKKVNLRKDGKTYAKYVHRLVAEAFVPKDHGKNEVNHINGHKDDNSYTNLEWVNRKENMEHAKRESLTRKSEIEFRGATKLSKEEYLEVLKLLNRGSTQKEIADIFNISQGLVSLIKLGG